MMHFYNIYNFRIRSELRLQCKEEIDKGQYYDISIRVIEGYTNEFESVSHIAWKYNGFLRSYDVTNGVLLCISNHIKIFVNRNGEEMIVDVKEESYEEVAQDVTGLALSIIVMFRGYIPIHSSAISYNNKIFGFVADSGTGKSTLLWNLLKRGLGFVTDDVLPTTFELNYITALPSISLGSKLWKTSMEFMNMEVAQYQPLVPNIEKYSLPINLSKRVVEKQVLHTLIILDPWEKDTQQNDIELSKIHGTALIPILLEHTHALWAMPESIQKSLFKQYTKLITTVNIYNLRYRREFEVMNDLTIFIENYIKTNNR